MSAGASSMSLISACAAAQPVGSSSDGAGQDEHFDLGTLL